MRVFRFLSPSCHSTTMKRTDRSTSQRNPRGFTLAAVLVVVGGLLVLAVGALLIASTERSTARLMSDRERANLVAHAAMEEIRGVVANEMTNDIFLVLSSSRPTPLEHGREPAPYLFVAQGTRELNGDEYIHRYVPLFSAAGIPRDGVLSAPEVEPLLGDDVEERIDFETLPYQDKVRVTWKPVRDERNRIVGRYAYWMEDMQARIDPDIAGNTKGDGGHHRRIGWPFTAPGLNDPAESEGGSPLDQIALFAIDPEATEQNQGELGRTLIANRSLLLSPHSLLAAADMQPPLTRLTAPSADGGFAGDLADPRARAVERALATGMQPYLERALIPYAPGIRVSSVGAPKLNLNQMLALDRDTAVDQLAAQIRRALPQFEERKGGFPDDYLKTLAANALDYADEDSDASVGDGYRGIDSYPLTTEIVLKVEYRNMTVEEGRQYLNFNIRLFAEVHNPTNVDISGDVRLSYEVALAASEIGTNTGSPAFDSELLLDRPEYSTHDLDKMAGRYWSKPIRVSLRPNEYKCFRFADVSYRLDQGLQSENEISAQTPFSLLEDKGASGCSLMWNGVVVERQEGMLRLQGFVYGVTNGVRTGGYLVGTPDVLSKCHLPGLLYLRTGAAGSGVFYANTGDPRVSHYLNRGNDNPLAESAYPENASPNRRTVRRRIYNNDPEASKPRVYARMLPSEWPDGGHDPPVGTWAPGSDNATELTDDRFTFPYDENGKFYAIQRISNRGYFLSATELGHVFDPIMFTPILGSTSDTNSFYFDSTLPSGVHEWPARISIAPHERDPLYGGGNTLRIGRAEHPVFAAMNAEASSLLNLFHVGEPFAQEEERRNGSLNLIHGQVNLNTASSGALRALAAGLLVMDPMLSVRLDTSHSSYPTAAPPSRKLDLGAPQVSFLADKIADALIANRPYASPSEVADAKDSEGRSVFGERSQYAESGHIRWTDAAAEELFSRVYQASTVRSRNFRVWIVAQAIRPTTSYAESAKVLSEVRVAHTLFADPGVRSDEGAIVPEKSSIRILYSNEF